MIFSAEDLFTLNSNKFRMVYKVDGNPQLDSRDWSMYSNILNEKWEFRHQLIRYSVQKRERTSATKSFALPLQ